MVAERQEALSTLHPWAWWTWAIGVGLAVSATTNPLLLTLLGLATVVVVVLRRTGAPWGRTLRGELLEKLVVLGVR